MASGTFDVYLIWYMAADLEPKPTPRETRLAPALGTSAASGSPLKLLCAPGRGIALRPGRGIRDPGEHCAL